MGEVYPPLAAPKATRGKGGGGKVREEKLIVGQALRGDLSCSA